MGTIQKKQVHQRVCLGNEAGATAASSSGAVFVDKIGVRGAGMLWVKLWCRSLPPSPIIWGAVLFVLCLSASLSPVFSAIVHAFPGEITRVSVSSSGEEGNFGGSSPNFTADGRYVAFNSFSTNLVAGDTNGTSDVFVHDRQTGNTSRVSVSSNGDQGNATSSLGTISADGRYVVFGSAATNLVAGDTNGLHDIFVHDRQTGNTSRVSVSSNGEQGDSNSYLPIMSANGRYVAFNSVATNLVAGDTNGWLDIFVHDRHTGTTERVDVSSSGEPGVHGGGPPSISADGRYVAFGSTAFNLVAGDTNHFPNGGKDVFVHDRQTGRTERVSVGSNGEQDNHSSTQPSISADGRYVAFRSGGSFGLAVDPIGWHHIFVHDRQTGRTERVSVASNGGLGNTDGFLPFRGSPISADGRYVGFFSGATNLLPGGAPFLLVGKESGQCLDITGGNTAVGNGVALQQYPCHGGANQQFRLTDFISNSGTSIVAAHSNKCLDVAFASLDNGTAINQYDCHEGLNQRWLGSLSVLPPSSGFTTFRVAHSGQCLTIPNPGVVGDEAVQATCNDGENQLFQLQPLGLDTNGQSDAFVHERSGPVNPPQALTVALTGTRLGTVTSNLAGIDCGSDCSEDYVSGSAVMLTATPDAGAVFTGWSGGLDWSGVGCSGNESCTVVMTQAHAVTATFSPATPSGFTTFSAVHSNKCLTIPNPGVVGDEAVQATCNGGDNQQFIVNFLAPDIREIVSRQSGQCLDITGGLPALGNGVALQQYPCHGGMNQQFRVPANKMTPFSSIQAVHSDKCLDVAFASSEDGMDINQYDCHEGLNQQWIWTDPGS